MVEIKGKEKIKVFLSLVGLVLFIGSLAYLSIRYAPGVKELLARPAKYKGMVEEHGLRAVAVFIGIQIFQVVVAAVPGEVVQVAGGYLFGTFYGMLYLVGGLVVGTIAAFFSARILGAPLLRFVISGSRRDRLLRLLNSPRSELIIFLLYLLPGLPKDALTYVAGLTPINPWRFLAISVLGRLPALVASCYIGASLGKNNLVAVVVVAALSALLLMGGLLSREWLVARMRTWQSSGAKDRT